MAPIASSRSASCTHAAFERAHRRGDAGPLERQRRRSRRRGRSSAVSTPSPRATPRGAAGRGLRRRRETSNRRCRAAAPPARRRTDRPLLRGRCQGDLPDAVDVPPVVARTVAGQQFADVSGGAGDRFAAVGCMKSILIGGHGPGGATHRRGRSGITESLRGQQLDRAAQCGAGRPFRPCRARWSQPMSGPENARSWAMSWMLAPVCGDQLGKPRQPAGPIADHGRKAAQAAVGDQPLVDHPA